MGTFKELYLNEKEDDNEYVKSLLDKGYVFNDEDLDFDNIEEEVEEDENCFYSDINEEHLNEKLMKKIVVRAGKKIKKWISTDKNKRVVADPKGGRPKEVIVKSKEKIARKKGQRKAKIKRAAKKAQSRIKRRISKLKRAVFGLK